MEGLHLSVHSLLTASVYVLAPTSGTKDAYGGFTDTGSSTTYPASVQVDTSSEALRYERETGLRTFSVYLDPSASIPQGSRIKVASGPYINTIIKFTAPKADHSGRGTYWMIRGTEVI